MESKRILLITNSLYPQKTDVAQYNDLLVKFCAKNKIQLDVYIYNYLTFQNDKQYFQEYYQSKINNYYSWIDFPIKPVNVFSPLKNTAHNSCYKILKAKLHFSAFFKKHGRKYGLIIDTSNYNFKEIRFLPNVVLLNHQSFTYLSFQTNRDLLKPVLNKCKKFMFHKILKAYNAFEYYENIIAFSNSHFNECVHCCHRVCVRRIFTIPKISSIAIRKNDSFKKNPSQKVLFLGDYDISKNNLHLINDVSHLLPYKIDCYGSGKDQRLLKDCNLKFQIADVKELENVLKKYSLLIVSSISDEWPNILSFAFAHGVPVVWLSDSASSSEIIGNNERGLLFNSYYSSYSIAKYIETLFKNQQNLTKMSKAAYNFWLEKLDPNVFDNKWLQVVQMLYQEPK